MMRPVLRRRCPACGWPWWVERLVIEGRWRYGCDCGYGEEPAGWAEVVLAWVGRQAERIRAYLTRSWRVCAEVAAMEAWRWVGRKGPEVPRLTGSYVRIRPTGVYVSMRAEEVPWPRASLPVEVGFLPGRVAIRRAEDGRTLSFGYARSRWSGQLTGAWIAEEARRYGIPLGVALPARWDAEAGMIVAEVSAEGAKGDGGQAAAQAG